MSRTIEIRLKQERDVRIKNGKRVEQLGPDPARIGAALHAQLEQAVREKYGEDVNLRFVTASQADIRLIGGYAEKSSEVKAAIWTMFGDAVEHLDADALG